MRKIFLFAALAFALAHVSYAQVPLKVSASHSSRTVALGDRFAKTEPMQNVTVLHSRKMAEGVVSRVLRDERGRVYRDVVMNGKVYGGIQRLVANPFKITENHSFFESFEGYNLSNAWAEWLPEGWTEINTPASTPTEESIANYYNNSWKGGYTGDGYWTATTPDGEKDCFIHFTYNVWNYDENNNPIGYKFKAAPQDEWLITPEISVKEGHNLMFLAEFDLSAIFNYSYTTGKYDRSKVDCDLEVLVSDANGAVVDSLGGKWTSLYKVSQNYASDKTDAELRAHLSKMKYYDIFIPLTQYHGKKVKLAFRYTNATSTIMVGNSMAVDAVAVDASPAIAQYDLPLGTLMAGFTEDLYTPNQSFALMAPYSRQTWEANSNNFTLNNKWEFYDSESLSMKTVAEGPDLNLKYEAVYPVSNGNAVPYPMLTASNDLTSSLFSYDGADESGKGGIYFDATMPQIMNRDLMVGNFDYVHKHLRIPDFGPNEYVYGLNNSWGDYQEVGFGNAFPAAANNFEISKVCFTLGQYEADADAEFTLEIHEVDAVKDTVIPTPVYTSTIKGSSIKNNDGIYQAIFPIVDSNGVPTTFNYGEKKIVVFIKGFANNPKVRKFAGCDQAVNNRAERESNFAYVILSINDEISYWNAVDALKDYYNAVYVSLLGKYNYIGSMEDEITLYADTETKDIMMASDSDPSLWTVQFGDSQTEHPLTSPVTNEWLTVSLTPSQSGAHRITFSGTKPATVRQQTLTFHSKNASFRMFVSQSDKNAVDITSIEKLSIAADRTKITVTGAVPAAELALYSINGQKVCVSRADSYGNAVMSHSLPAGIYILRINNRAYKVIL